MKLKISLRQAFSLLAGMLTYVVSPACGPFCPIIPTPEFFAKSAAHRPMSDYDKEENLLLWQSQTSPQISLTDIEEAVYKDSYSAFCESTGYRPTRRANAFYAWLNNTGDGEIVSYLTTAKELEEARAAMQSPWYYPSSRMEDEAPYDFNWLITRCRSYRGRRFRERYALLVTRALFASRQYGACIEYTDSAFAGVADSHLMKRMACRYLAGCWNRLGDKAKADSVFAATGDIWSISEKDRAGYMARHNPAAPQLMEYIRCNATDTAFMLGLEPVARRLLKDSRVKDKGDWYFMLAYIDHTFKSGDLAALGHIRNAVRHSFSTEEMQTLARAYKMKLEGCAGDNRSLLADLKWIEGKCGLTAPDAQDWIRRCRNVIYVHWVPVLWKRGDYASALLLCAYADNIDTRRLQSDMYDYAYDWPAEVYDQTETFNPVDYRCLSFQLMQCLSSAELEGVFGKMKKRNPLYDFLRKKVRTDNDYYYELIGTLALREENYGRAEKFFARVSDSYWKGMNIYPYLGRDPFSPWQSRSMLTAVTAASPVPGSAGMYLRTEPSTGAKIDFARKMHAFQQQASKGRTADERGLARLMYAIGRLNSIENCWALTRYWKGYVDLFEPILSYWSDANVSEVYDILDDSQRQFDREVAGEVYDNEVKWALSMLTTDEARARAHYILGHFPTVIRDYANTATGRHVKTSCDNWRHWLSHS